MAFDTGQIRANLAKSQHLVEQLRKVSGAPGIAVGVIHGGHIIYEHYNGHREVESSLPVNKDTIFHVASLTKAMTAAAIGILVDRGDLEWDTPVEEILPFFKNSQTEKSKLTMVDFLSHRTGTTWGDALYLQSNNNIMLPKDESLRTFEYLPTISSPRSQYLYNNHAYNVPGFVIEALSKQSYGAFMRENIFLPLDMTRTHTHNPKDPNVAVSYNILSDGTAFRIPFSEASADTMMFSGVSVRTSMADLLRLYKAFLKEMKPLIPGKNMSGISEGGIFKALSRTFCGLFGRLTPSPAPSSPSDCEKPASATPTIKQIARIFGPSISRSCDTLYEQTSALGWNRTELPGKLEFGWNSTMVAAMPLLGESYPGKLALWHGGNMPGMTAAVILLPQTTTAVVVLQNSLGLCDAADWTAQLLLDCVLTGVPQQNYISLALEAAKNGSMRMKNVAEQLERERKPGTTHRPLQEYTGAYQNAIKNWTIEISVDSSDQLNLRFQRRADEQYALRHYHDDVFVWNLTYDETVKRAQYCRSYKFYRFHFESNQNNCISFLRWHHDPNISEGEVFVKGQI